MRAGRGLSLPGRQLLRWRAVQADQAARSARCAAGLCAGGFDRQIRRRHRQLAVAAPHRRFRLLPRLCRPRRFRGGLCRGERPLPARASSQGQRGRLEGRRFRDGCGLSRVDPALCHAGRGREHLRLAISHLRDSAQRMDRHDRSGGSGRLGCAGQIRIAACGAQQLRKEPARTDRGRTPRRAGRSPPRARSRAGRMDRWRSHPRALWHRDHATLGAGRRERRGGADQFLVQLRDQFAAALRRPAHLSPGAGTPKARCPARAGLSGPRHDLLPAGSAGARQAL